MTKFTIGAINADGAVIAVGDGAVAIGHGAKATDLHTGTGDLQVSSSDLPLLLDQLAKLQTAVETRALQSDAAFAAQIAEMKAHLTRTSGALPEARRSSFVTTLREYAGAAGAVFDVATKVAAFFL